MRLQTGYVTYFNPVDGVGMISPTKGGKELFVNRASIATPEKNLLEGQQVEFSIHRGTNGLTAYDVIVY